MFLYMMIDGLCMCKRVSALNYWVMLWLKRRISILLILFYRHKMWINLFFSFLDWRKETLHSAQDLILNVVCLCLKGEEQIISREDWCGLFSHAWVWVKAFSVFIWGSCPWWFMVVLWYLIAIWSVSLDLRHTQPSPITHRISKPGVTGL